jgi:hypothetical protein
MFVATYSQSKNLKCRTWKAVKEVGMLIYNNIVGKKFIKPNALLGPTSQPYFSPTLLV